MENKKAKQNVCDLKKTMILDPRCVSAARSQVQRSSGLVNADTTLGFCAGIKKRHDLTRPRQMVPEQIYLQTLKPFLMHSRLTINIPLSFAFKFSQFSTTLRKESQVKSPLVERYFVASREPIASMRMPLRFAPLLREISEHRFRKESKIRSQERTFLVSGTTLDPASVSVQSVRMPESPMIYRRPSSPAGDNADMNTAESSRFSYKSQQESMTMLQDFEKNVSATPIPLGPSELGRLADQVLTALDRRTLAYRERMGRI